MIFCFVKSISRLHEIYEMDNISFNKVINIETKQTKTKTFCGVSEKTVLNCLVLFVRGRINCPFYKFFILLGCRSKSKSMRGFKITILRIIAVSLQVRIVNVLRF